VIQTPLLRSISGGIVVLPVAIAISPSLVSVASGFLFGMLVTSITKTVEGPILCLVVSLVGLGVIMACVGFFYSDVKVPGWLVVVAVLLGVAIGSRLMRMVSTYSGQHSLGLVIIGVLWSVLFTRLPVDSLEGLRQLTQRGGDGASFLLNFADSYQEQSDSYTYSVDVGANGGAVLGTFITWFQSVSSMISSETSALVFQPLLMWRMSWLLIYLSVVGSVVIIGLLVPDRSVLTQLLIASLLSILFGGYGLALLKPGLFSAVLAVLVLVVAIALGLLGTSSSSASFVLMSLICTVGLSQAWFPFGSIVGFAFAIGIAWTIFRWTEQHGLKSGQSLKSVRGKAVSGLLILGLGLFASLQDFLGLFAAPSKVTQLAGLGGGDAPVNLNVLGGVVIAVLITFAWKRPDSYPAIWLYSLLLGTTTSVVAVLLLAYLGEPYWIEYGPRKFLTITGVALIPLALSGLLRLSGTRPQVIWSVAVVSSILLVSALTTEPFHQFSQLLKRQEDQPWLNGMHTALSDYPNQRIICIDTMVDGTGWAAYSCSEFGLGITGHRGAERVFLGANVCWASASQLDQFDSSFYRETIILLSDRLRLSSTTGCQERGWEADGQSDDDRRMLGWVSAIDWTNSVVLDYEGTPIQPNFDYLRGHPDYPEEVIQSLWLTLT